MVRYYYVDRQHKTAGPATLEEIDSLIRMEKIQADPMIVPEGSSRWQRLSQHLGGAPTGADASGGTARGLRFRPTFIADGVIGRPLEWLGRSFPAPRLASGLRLFATIGQIALLITFCLAPLVWLVNVLRVFPHLTTLNAQEYRSWLWYTLEIFLVAAAVVLGQYVNERIFRACDTAVARTPHHVSSPAILQGIDAVLKVASVGVLIGGAIHLWISIHALGKVPRLGEPLGGDAGLTGTIALIGGPVAGAVVGIAVFVYHWITESPINIVVGTATSALVLFFISCLARCPSALNLTVADVASGEDAVALLAFFNMGILKTVSISFCLSACLDVYLWTVALIHIINGSERYADPLVPTAVACLLPIGAYAVFLLFNLLIELMRALLISPRTIAASKDRPPVRDAADVT